MGPSLTALRGNQTSCYLDFELLEFRIVRKRISAVKQLSLWYFVTISPSKLIHILSGYFFLPVPKPEWGMRETHPLFKMKVRTDPSSPEISVLFPGWHRQHCSFPRTGFVKTSAADEIAVFCLGLCCFYNQLSFQSYI